MTYSKQAKLQAGFTLIEVIVSVTLLAFLSIFTARSIHQGFIQKNKIQKKINKSSQLRAALSVMSRDIQLAFNYKDQNIALFNLAQLERKKRFNAAKKKPKTKDKTKTSDPPDTTPPPPEDPNEKNPNAAKTPNFEPKEEVILTHFIGTDDELHFTSLSHVRTQPDVQQGDQAEVGYFLKECRNRVNSKLKSQCLWRRLAYVMDDEVEKGGSSTVVLENVTELKFRYLGPGHEEEWISAWKSKDSLDEATKNNFPYAVEITIETKNKNIKNDRALTMTQVAQLRFPNNPDPEKTPQTGTIAPPPTSGNTSGGTP